MYCTKCSYTSFDHNANCPKCGYDWKKEKESLNLAWINAQGFDWLNMPMPAASRADAGFSFEPVAPDADVVAEVDLGARGQSRDTLDLDAQAMSASGGVGLESMDIADDALNLDVPDAPPAAVRPVKPVRPAPRAQAAPGQSRQPTPPVNTEVSVDGLEELLAQSQTAPKPATPGLAKSAAKPAIPVQADLEIPEISLDLDEPAPASPARAAKTPAPDADIVLDFGTPAQPEVILSDTTSGIELELDFSSLEPEPLPVTRHPDAKGKELVLDMPEGLEWELEEEDEPAPPKKS